MVHWSAGRGTRKLVGRVVAIAGNERDMKNSRVESRGGGGNGSDFGKKEVLIFYADSRLIVAVEGNYFSK